MKEINPTLFGTAGDSPRSVAPTNEFRQGFDVERYRLEKLDAKLLPSTFRDLVYRVISSVSDGVQLVLSWVLTAMQDAMQDHLFVFDKSKQEVYMPVKVIAIPEAHRTDSSWSRVVWAGDSIRLTDGSICLVKQPLIKVSSGQEHLLIQEYIRECSAAGFDRQQAMEGGIILTENESIIPASQIQGSVVVMRDLMVFRKIAEKGRGSIFLHRFNRKVTAVPAARKPIGNLERDCPPDKVTFKKAQRELYILTDDMPPKYGISDTEAKFEGSMWCARTILTRMSHNKKGAEAVVVLRNFPEVFWHVLFHGQFKHEQNPGKIVRVIISPSDTNRWRQLHSMMHLGGWTAFPEKSLTTQEASRPGVPETVLRIEKPMVFDYVRDLMRGNKLIVTFAYSKHVTQQSAMLATVRAALRAVGSAEATADRLDISSSGDSGHNNTHAGPLEAGQVQGSVPAPHVTNEEVLFLGSEEEDDDVVAAVHTAEALVHS